MHPDRAHESAAPRTILANGHLSIEDVCAVAHCEARLQLTEDPHWRHSISSSAERLRSRVLGGQTVYGINTGYGESCDRPIPPELIEALPANLVAYHGCGLGDAFDEPATAAILAVRTVSLARGFSAVRVELLESLCALLDRRILPRIPQEGSVGASGDLTPLSYVAATLVGQRTARFRGQWLPSAEALRLGGLVPLQLAPKEGLAIMNGTAVMTALACLAFQRAQALYELACIVTALDVTALEGHSGHFDARLFELKPHPGTIDAARRIRDWLGSTEPQAVQDPYSLRCAPHVLGVLADALAWMRPWIETELNSSNDNPLYDPASDRILHGGHFYGGHIGFAMDGLKTAVASVADLLDRQVALLIDPHRSRGLPHNLSGAPAALAHAHHGFKAVQIGASAWTAEALKLTLPATSFSRSTEGHNQDKVSMGTIAARDALRVIELAEQVAAAGLLAGVQALWLRSGKEAGAVLRSRRLDMLVRSVHAWSAPVREDRPLEADLRAALERLRSRPDGLGALLGTAVRSC
jgi:histidine ammonia-lyase